MLLRDVMTRHGFRPLESEWWHFTLENEPYPDTFFTFPRAPARREGGNQKDRRTEAPGSAFSFPEGKIKKIFVICSCHPPDSPRIRMVQDAKSACRKKRNQMIERG